MAKIVYNFYKKPRKKRPGFIQKIVVELRDVNSIKNRITNKANDKDKIICNRH